MTHLRRRRRRLFISCEITSESISRRPSSNPASNVRCDGGGGGGGGGPSPARKDEPIQFSPDGVINLAAGHEDDGRRRLSRARAFERRKGEDHFS